MDESEKMQVVCLFVFFNLANVFTVAKGFVPSLIFFYPMNRRLVVIALIAMCALDMVDGKLARSSPKTPPFPFTP